MRESRAEFGAHHTRQVSGYSEQAQKGAGVTVFNYARPQVDRVRHELEGREMNERFSLHTVLIL